MATLLLQFKDALLEKFVLNTNTLSIGRDPQNDIVIDNLAVSRYHAKISRNEYGYVVEDLQSGNGTFVNDEHVHKQVLRNRDTILIGKHTLVFINEEKPSLVEDDEDKALSLAEETFILPSKHRAAWMTDNDNCEGSLTILSGRETRKHLPLTKQTTIGGKSAKADIKLRGLFVGSIAFIISRTPTGFSISHSEGKRRPRVNGRAIKGQQPLRDGDTITIGLTRLQFHEKPPGNRNA